MICPTCKKPTLIENSIGEEFYCTNCQAFIGLYDKARHKLIRHD